MVVLFLEGRISLSRGNHYLVKGKDIIHEIDIDNHLSINKIHNQRKPLEHRNNSNSKNANNKTSHQQTLAKDHRFCTQHVTLDCCTDYSLKTLPQLLSRNNNGLARTAIITFFFGLLYGLKN